MPVQILLSQSGASAGVPGQARNDFVTGTPVQATAVGGPYASYLWSFVSKAIDVTAGTRASSAFGSATSSTTGVDPVDVAGEYLLQVAVDSGQGLGATEDDVARIVFYAGTTGGDSSVGPLNTDPAELPQRMPAFREQLEDNTADPIDSGGNTEGWSRPWLRLKAVIDRMYMTKSWAWARVNQTGSATNLVAGFNVGVTRTSVGKAHVTFPDRNMPSGNYAVVLSTRGAGGSVTSLNEVFNGFDVERADIGGSLADLDWNFEVKVQS